jgi:hypothetical protein
MPERFDGVQSSLYVVYLKGVGLTGTVIGLQRPLCQAAGERQRLTSAAARRRRSAASRSAAAGHAGAISATPVCSRSAEPFFEPSELSSSIRRRMMSIPTGHRGRNSIERLSLRAHALPHP